MRLPNYYFGHILFLIVLQNKGYYVRNAKNFLMPALSVWILTACTTMTPSVPVESAKKVTWDSRQTRLRNVQSWQLSGKIAVITNKDSGSATVDWSQHAQNYTISLYGPLGSNGMTLKGGPGHVTMTTSNQAPVSANSAEQLLAKQWGWNLPLSNLRYWVRGLPVPNLEAQSTLDSANRLTTLRQQGFVVQYQSYTRSGDLELPQRISIEGPALKSKIVIYRWNVA